MTKAELAEVLTQEHGLKKSLSLAVTKTLFEAIKNALIEGQEVSIRDFGTFKIKKREERMGHNPGTGEKLLIPASSKAVWKPASSLKNLD